MAHPRIGLAADRLPKILGLTLATAADRASDSVANPVALVGAESARGLQSSVEKDVGELRSEG